MTKKKKSNKYASYLLIPVVAIIVFALTMRIKGVFTIEELDIFLTVVGLLYGLIGAFAISNSWERFNILRLNIGEETSAFKNIFLMSQALTDQSIVSKLSRRIKTYCEEIIETDFNDYPTTESLHEKFRKVFRTIDHIEPKNDKDLRLFDNILGAMRNASKSRIHQLVAIQDRMSHFRWMLIYMLSGVLVAGFMLIEGQHRVIDSLTVTAITVIVLLLLYLIRELNDLSFEFEGITRTPYQKIIELLAMHEKA